MTVMIWTSMTMVFSRTSMGRCVMVVMTRRIDIMSITIVTIVGILIMSIIWMITITSFVMTKIHTCIYCSTVFTQNFIFCLTSNFLFFQQLISFLLQFFHLFCEFYILICVKCTTFQTFTMSLSSFITINLFIISFLS